MEIATSEMVTATVGSAQEEAHHSSNTNPAGSPNTVHATAGCTPPLRTRPSSSLSKGKKSRNKKVPASKRAKEGTVAAKARDSKISGGSRKGKRPASRPGAAATEPWKMEQAEVAHTLSRGGTSESLVTISKDTASTDEPMSPLFKKRGLSSSSSKRSNSPEQPANSAAKNKQGTVPASPKQISNSSNAAKKQQNAMESGLFASEFSRSTTKSFKKTSKVSHSKSRESDTNKTSKPVPREGSNVDSSPVLDILVTNMRDITSEVWGAASSVEDSATMKLPFSSGADGALQLAPNFIPDPPLPPVATRDAAASGAQVAPRPAAPGKGCDFFEFAVATGTGSLILLVLLYLIKGFRSHILACTDNHNCTTANATYPPYT